MNNKKLFRGALVLFASILMAVSCSSNSNPGDDGKGGGNAETPQVKEVGKAEVEKWIRTLETIEDSGKQTFTFSSATVGAGDPLTVAITGTGSTGSANATILTSLRANLKKLSKTEFVIETDIDSLNWSAAQTTGKKPNEVVIKIKPATGVKFKSDIPISGDIKISLTPETDWTA